MKISLIIEAGPNKGEVIALEKSESVFGKSAECDIRIPSGVVSRRHCGISVENDRAVLRDLGSKNGTFVNGKKVSAETELKPGDKIKIGPMILEVRMESSEPNAPEVAPQEPDAAAQPDKQCLPAAQDKASAPEDDIPVAIAIDEESAPEAASPEKPFSPDAQFYLRVAECLVAAREAFLGHYRGSTRRTRDILAMLAGILNLTQSETQMLDIAGLTYDVGKLLLPSAMINKRGPLTPDERRAMQKHPEASVSFFKDARLPEPVIAAILSHHEHWDGSGYPKGLRGGAIPRLASVLAIGDCLSATTSSRPYRTSMSTARAIDEIESGAGTHFDTVMARRIADYCRLNMTELRDITMSGD